MTAAKAAKDLEGSRRGDWRKGQGTVRFHCALCFGLRFLVLVFIALRGGV